MMNLAALVPPLLDLCREAGELICEHYHAPSADQYEAKGDDSPLTLADIASHHCLEAGLAALAPDIPILSEESPPEAVARRREWSSLWLVDPLDGTKEFLGRTGEFTINIALVHDGAPLLGVIYIPLEAVAYVGVPGEFARRYGPEDEVSDIATRALVAGEPMRVLASRRHKGERLGACLAWLERHWGELARDNSGSALKFCHLAEGRGDFYPRYAPCCEWDTAAGQALLEAAGGALVGLDGLPLRYNARDTLLSEPFLAVGDAGHALWQQLLQET
ncbi:3'(2'),5'-bisphosphate nucleotidase [Halioglobus japonicus]|uniref:3'(2'),5'-bisphosphate nucleotidase CysQ n=1 Tax=Halioglobus japonicus TaxID=930805 RepID=A0AAP8SLM4_9GAMM|nr:3'(2'),5'-bisphosphate nucleotidase CysQ [Halioglobus japonicus]AQA20050.1 3'(2'),5'-bisphosphate nucleotidase [Halioglobus japonicus]PLW84707.1 3'(2'),5'-bisphosphate nucleotidase [Halioglobus japonicus]GHD21004.1 3'(2'),5'-bisphosphate nucleotidase CysQ [Halioglobus japonicus]